MKKIFLTMVVCLMATMGANSQNNNGWVKIFFEADELTDTSMEYENEIGSVVLWDNEDKVFRVISKDEMFNGKVENWTLGKHKTIFTAIIGFYDINKKLVKKTKCTFEIGANHHEGNAIRNPYYTKNDRKDIIEYLKNGNGFVRIVAPLSLTNKNFDIMVPCLNNN